ncbi:hypothetical protein Hanom_Chr15g01379061 [Helianthus anomalus]
MACLLPLVSQPATGARLRRLCPAGYGWFSGYTTTPRPPSKSFTPSLTGEEISGDGMVATVELFLSDKTPVSFRLRVLLQLRSVWIFLVMDFLGIDDDDNR